MGRAGRKPGVLNRKSIDPHWKEKEDAIKLIGDNLVALTEAEIALAKGIKMVKMTDNGEEEVYTTKPNLNAIKDLKDRFEGKSVQRTEVHTSGVQEFRVIAAPPKREPKPNRFNTIEKLPQLSLPEAVIEGEFSEAEDQDD